MLKDFVIRKDTMTFQGGSVELRGLALADITVLIRDYLDELNALFKLYQDEKTRDTAVTQSVKFATAILVEAPLLAAQMIACAADEGDIPEALETAKKLPLPTQVEMVRKIIDLTFEEAGGAKKFGDMLMGMVVSLAPANAGVA